MHEVDDGFHRIDRGFREDAVAEIEDVAGAPAHRIENPLGMPQRNLSWCKQHSGIEVALDRAIVTCALPSVFDRCFPIEADDGATRFTLQFEERLGSCAKMDHRYARLLNILQDVSNVGLHVFFVVFRGELADP